MEIRPYPEFVPLAKDSKPLFDEAFKIEPPEISEFTFTNLYAWRQAYALSLSRLNDFIIVRSEKFAQQRFFAPIGRGDLKPVMEEILKDTQGLFMRLPEPVKSLFDGDARFSTEADLNNSDYLFAASDLKLLPGKKYDGKRNLIRKFKSAYQYEYIKLDALNAGECLAFEDAWCSIKDCDSQEGLSSERRAIGEMVDNFSDFGLIGGAIKVNGVIAAAAIAERLNPRVMVMHILKADPNIPGLYQVMSNDFLLREAGDFQYVNLEQDLGVAGLRKSKLSYHPLRMINKYTLRLTARAGQAVLK